MIASVASAAAALVTSRFSTIGTPVAAALTPVIVALVSEMLHRPTEKIASRLTTDRPRVLAEGMGGGPPDAHPTEALPDRAPAEPGAETGPAEPPVRVYGRSGSPRRQRRRIAVGVVALTGLLGFAIAAIALTGADLATGGADRPTILGKKKDTKDEPERTVPEQQTAPETVPQDEEAPKKDEPEQTAPETTPTTPTQTAPTPPPAPAPAPQQGQPPPP